MPRRHLILVLALGSVLFACSDRTAGPDAGTDAGLDDAGPPDSGPPPPFTLSTSSFAEGDPIPQSYQCGPPIIATGPGANTSPALSWTAGPADTGSYALVTRDMTAGGLVHWVIYDIPASLSELPEDVPPGYEPVFPSGAKQAEIQTSNYFGYFGPCSGGAGNTYQWTLHAIASDTLPGATMLSTDVQLAALVEEASTASASFTGVW